MNEQRLQTLPGFGSAGSLAADRNRVLRNTYWLLALSMVPTVLGAWIGVSTGTTPKPPAEMWKLRPDGKVEVFPAKASCPRENPTTKNTSGARARKRS